MFKKICTLRLTVNLYKITFCRVLLHIKTSTLDQRDKRLILKKNHDEARKRIEEKKKGKKRAKEKTEERENGQKRFGRDLALWRRCETMIMLFCLPVCLSVCLFVYFDFSGAVCLLVCYSLVV